MDQSVGFQKKPLLTKILSIFVATKTAGHRVRAEAGSLGTVNDHRQRVKVKI